MQRYTATLKNQLTHNIFLIKLIEHYICVTLLIYHNLFCNELLGKVLLFLDTLLSVLEILTFTFAAGKNEQNEFQSLAFSELW